jgi:RimJ/RimL family protein N-acetyltransferase
MTLGRMLTLLPQLDGRYVRLEPLQPSHAAGLADAAAEDPALYQLTPVPQGEPAAAEYIEPWPQGHPRYGSAAPDVCEIGYTWLARSAIRTAANTEMKRLMLGHAFEVWEVESVCLHTDARNERSRRAMERIGAQFEGILRAHRLGTDCLPRNSARYSVTAPEWPRVKRALDDMLAPRAELARQP